MRIRQRGATILEAALVLPLLFTFLFAIIEFGRAFNMYQTMTNAAREGARFGVAPCQSGDPGQESCSFEGERFDSGYLPAMTTVTRFVNQYLAAANMKNVSSVEVTRPTPVPETFSVNGETHTRSYHYLAVDVRANYNWLFFPFPDLPLHANSVMKYEIDLEP